MRAEIEKMQSNNVFIKGGENGASIAETEVAELGEVLAMLDNGIFGKVKKEGYAAEAAFLKRNYGGMRVFELIQAFDMVVMRALKDAAGAIVEISMYERVAGVSISKCLEAYKDQKALAIKELKQLEKAAAAARPLSEEEKRQKFILGLCETIGEFISEVSEGRKLSNWFFKKSAIPLKVRGKAEAVPACYCYAALSAALGKDLTHQEKEELLKMQVSKTMLIIKQTGANIDSETAVAQNRERWRGAAAVAAARKLLQNGGKINDELLQHFFEAACK